jgi:hypothetical protein
VRRVVATAVAIIAFAAGSTAKAATAVSSNWAGYAVSETTFSSVS